MLQTMHDRLKGWVAAVLVGAIAASFVFWGVQYFVGAKGSKNVVAEVGDVKITQEAVDRLYSQLRQDAQTRGVELTQDYLTSLKVQALNDLITEDLLVQSARISGFLVAPSQINAFITQLPVLQENGGFSVDRYKRLLAVQGMRPSQFAANIRDFLSQQQVAWGIENSAFVLPSELKQAYILRYQRREFQYVRLASKRFKNITLSSQKLREYYEQHRESFKTPERVQVAYVRLSLKTLAQKNPVSAEDIQSYYKEQETLGRPIKQTPQEVKQYLTEQKMLMGFNRARDQLVTLSYTHPHTLKPAAQALHVSIQTSEFFDKNGRTQQGKTNKVIGNARVLQAVFSPSVLQEGNNSEVVELKKGDVVVLRVTNHQPQRILSFQEVRLTVQQQLTGELAKAKALLLADKIKQAALTRTSETLLRTNQLTWRKATIGVRGQATFPESFLKAVFSLEGPGAATVVSTGPDEVSVVQLIKVYNPPYPKASEAQLNALRQEVLGYFGRLEYEFYVESAKKRIKIHLYPDRLE